MMKHSQEQLSKELQTRWNYEPYLIEGVLEKLFAMDQELQTAFDTYLDTGVFPEDPSYFGLSAPVIHRDYPFEPPAVFMLLDWIRKEPDAALEALVTEYRKPLPDEFDASELAEWKSNSKSK